ncbi:MAG: aspartate kinase [Bdellovibrionales bacterium]|nr:aspartate kinase [Bdellovibrionales bacterium]
MAIRVQKYGGSSVANIHQINAVAEQVSAIVKAGDRVIVVVSAMGDTTDDLANLALELSPSPNRRELDMLLSTGERVTMALLSIALNAKGCAAISFTGSQAGILTDSSHTNARITDLKPTRVQKELETGSVVVLAGFQGVNPVTKEITTLGRGGSDSTAVAMAGHFKATSCEIMKDVDGVYSADPRLVPEAHHIDRISYDHLLEMTFWGSQVLHYRSVEMAKLHQVTVVIAKSHGAGDRRTVISNNDMPSPIEATLKGHGSRPLSLNTHKEVLEILPYTSGSKLDLELVHEIIQKQSLPLPDFLIATEAQIFLTGPSELLTSLKVLSENQNHFSLSKNTYSCVAITYLDPVSATDADHVQKMLQKDGIYPAACISKDFSVAVVVNESQRIQSLRFLHKMCFP